MHAAQLLAPLWIFLVIGIIAVTKSIEKSAQRKKQASGNAAFSPAAKSGGRKTSGTRSAGSIAKKTVSGYPEDNSSFKEMDREFHSLEFHDEDTDDCYAVLDESRQQADEDSGRTGDISHMFSGMSDLVRGIVWAEILHNKNAARNGEENYDTASNTGTCL